MNCKTIYNISYKDLSVPIQRSFTFLYKSEFGGLLHLSQPVFKNRSIECDGLSIPTNLSNQILHQPGAKEKTTYKINCKWLIINCGPTWARMLPLIMSKQLRFPYVYTDLYVFVPV
jgi:hypothetical protein